MPSDPPPPCQPTRHRQVGWKGQGKDAKEKEQREREMGEGMKELPIIQGEGRGGKGGGG